MIGKILNSIGSLFVYRSESKKEQYYRRLNYLSCRQLWPLAGTKTHYKKATLIKMALENKFPQS